ncbi:L-serine ammonia-lyase, iron-sulfur-dependent, subunit alpha [Proteinivorax hydrogeniformans]|uniref:UPF0597 protein PRVXH_001835 n=1 Tax=Proteinivorax hydrogeniformans TaxID=1826727 RepID=A0AAU8HQS9_9FIRM
MNLEKIIIDTLQKEVAPVTGCTEPVAVALACSKARELISSDDIKSINIYVSPNVYKNGLAVGVPHTGEVGLHIAAALGLVAPQSSKGLALLKYLNCEDVKKAKSLLKAHQIQIGIEDTDDKVYVKVELQSDNNQSKVVIQGCHDRFVYLEQDGNVLKNQISQNETKAEKQSIYSEKISALIETIEKISLTDIKFLIEGAHMNKDIARYGLENKCGMGVGRTLNQYIEKGVLSDDIIIHAEKLTAAASDARMSGVTLPVMTSNGSGNNGLTAILPIVAYQEKVEVSEEKLAKALAISHILNSYVKHYIGRLSPLCGCGVAAGLGAGAAITWLMGGTLKQIEGAIQNILGDICGMICDGAKVGCALKLSTSASIAVKCALLALDNQIIPAGNGIIAKTPERTIKNLSNLATVGMQGVDLAIITAMQKNN